MREKVNKFFYVWISLISGLDCKTVIKLISPLNYSFYDFYNLTMNYDKFVSYLKNNNIFLSRNIFKELISFKIKQKSKYFYRFILKKNIQVISFLSKELENSSLKYFPVIYLYGDIKLLNKCKYYIYSEKNSNEVLNIESMFKKHILSSKNVLVEKYNKIEANDQNCIYIGDLYDLTLNFNFEFNNNLFLFLGVGFNICVSYILDKLIIVNAKYKNDIVNIVDRSLEHGTEILVAPNSIMDKNAYFSNLLIYEGADVILNLKDL